MLMYLLGHIKGLQILWFAFPIAEVTSFTLLVFWLLSTIKKTFANMDAQPASYQT